MYSNCVKKITQSIITTNRWPTSKWKRYQFHHFRWTPTKSKTYGQTLTYFYTFLEVTCILRSYPFQQLVKQAQVEISSSKLDMTTISHAQSNVRFINTNCNFGKKRPFLGDSFEIKRQCKNINLIQRWKTITAS